MKDLHIGDLLVVSLNQQPAEVGRITEFSHTFNINGTRQQYPILSFDLTKDDSMNSALIYYEEILGVWI